MITILILAAGQSSRMRGGDKMMEEVAGRPCLQVLTARALASGADVVVVLPELGHPRAKAASGARVVAAADAHLGMAHSIRAGIAAVPASSTGVMILPGDMPEIETDDIVQLITRFEAGDAMILQAATSTGKPGHPILFDSALLPEFAELSGDRGAHSIIEAHRSQHALWPLPGNRARLDLDTPEDWVAWRASRG